MGLDSFGMNEVVKAFAEKKRFWVFLVGAGEGCDYTIACNQRLVPLDAEDRESAEKNYLRR